jgi:serine/threonine protein kinase
MSSYWECLDRSLPAKEERNLAREREELQKLVNRYLDPETQTRKANTEQIDESGAGARPRLSHASICTSTNHYVIKDKIGEGGMGVVYRAFDEKLRRDVAIKVLFNTDDDSLERFIREQEITACLDHPSFVRVLAIGYVTLRDRSLPFYAMPLIRGQTLERLILRRLIHDPEGLRLRKEFTQATVLRMLGQLCLTLQSAHDKRVIHRDLKPSNILIGPYGDVYVTDLGLAKFLTPDANDSGLFDIHVLEQLAKAQRMDVTQEAIMGTPYYMAPEQGLTPRAVDHRADIFGLGAILYFLLAGCKPQYLHPWLDEGILKTRKTELLGELSGRTGPEFNVEGLLLKPVEKLAPEIRPLVAEYRDLVDAIQGSDYHRFRLTMKQCSIIPPSEVLSEYYGNRESEDGAGSEPLDPVLEAICMKALAKRPEDRFPTCRVFWEALHGYVEAKEMAAR